MEGNEGASSFAADTAAARPVLTAVSPTTATRAKPVLTPATPTSATDAKPVLTPATPTSATDAEPVLTGVTPSSATDTDDPVVARADEFVAWLAGTSGCGVDDRVRVDRIAALERVKGALAAAQVRQTVAFAVSQRSSLPSWTPERRVARSIGSQVGLARGESPPRGDAHAALAHALVTSLPQTLAALTTGRISEAAAEGVHRALEGMDPALKREVDAQLVPELGLLGERSLAEAARRVANAVDDEAASRRVERAALSRRVTLRTAKDGMAYLTVLAPMAEAAGAFQAVEAEASALLGQPGSSGGPSRRSVFWLADPQPASTDPGAAPADPQPPVADPETAPGSPSASGSPSAPGSPAAPHDHPESVTDGAADVSGDWAGRAGDPGSVTDSLAGIADGAVEAGEASARAGAAFFRPPVLGTRSQVMADVVISRLTGRAIGQPVPIEIQLVMTDETLADPNQDRGRTTQSSPSESAPQWSGSTPRTESGNEDPAGTQRRPAPAGGVSAPARRARGGETSGHPAFPNTPPWIDNVSGAHPSSDRDHLAGSRTEPQSSSPAKVVGAGWLPAGFARELVRRTLAAGSSVTVRRVLTSSDGSTVIGLEARRHSLTDPARGATRPMSSATTTAGSATTPALGALAAQWSKMAPVLAPTSSVQRLYRGILRRLIVIRDQNCRTPFCGAAIRAIDHVTPARRDGPTCTHNGQGTCDRCNFTKEAPGWKVVVLSPPPPPKPNRGEPPWQQLLDDLLADEEPHDQHLDERHRTAVITPTGHIYESAAPAIAHPAREGSATG